ncbi:MAG: hypothetical protein WD334_07225 [Chitinophagales bacterium]
MNGKKFLIDTNVIIDYFGSKLPQSGEIFLDSLKPVISVITRIELLGFQGIKSNEFKILKEFIAVAHIYNLEEAVILKTIEIRKKHRIENT